jgi:hypothetical protein
MPKLTMSRADFISSTGLPSTTPILMSIRGIGVQEQAVIDETIDSTIPPQDAMPPQDDTYFEVAAPESSGIHPAIYALGAGALLLGGLLLFRN